MSAEWSELDWLEAVLRDDRTQIPPEMARRLASIFGGGGGKVGNRLRAKLRAEGTVKIVPEADRMPPPYPGAVQYEYVPPPLAQSEAVSTDIELADYVPAEPIEDPSGRPYAPYPAPHYLLMGDARLEWNDEDVVADSAGIQHSETVASEPPRFAAGLLTFLVPLSRQDALLGDLDERFNARTKLLGLRGARIWYFWQVIREGLGGLPGYLWQALLTWILGGRLSQ